MTSSEPKAGFDAVPAADDDDKCDTDASEVTERAKSFRTRRIISLAACAVVLMLAALRVQKEPTNTDLASDSVEKVIVSASESIDNMTATNTTTSTITVTTTTTTPEPPSWLQQGSLYVQCCKVVKSYGVVPGLKDGTDLGQANSKMRNWWANNKCDDVVGDETSYNPKQCDVAASTAQCCQVAKDWKIEGNTSWGWAIKFQGVQKWWNSEQCEQWFGEGGTYDSPICQQVDEVLTNSSGGKELGVCLPLFRAPERPKWATQHNGVALQDTCFLGDNKTFHAFIIGDWGGMYGPSGIEAAKHLSHRHERGQGFVFPIDQNPQLRVRDQMRGRASWADPDYILNVGDNFYWAGIEDWCGAADFTTPYSHGGTGVPRTNQFKNFYEDVYTGEGLDGKQWLGVLGNHDYGGWMFNHAWDQMIGYTWSDWSSGKWFTPSQYWRSTVRYPDFSVDYYFLDTNVYDALDPYNGSPHNLCNMGKMGGGASCPNGPANVWSCPAWFKDLWEKQKDWLNEEVPKSNADWRIIVTHFPPYFNLGEWQWLAKHFKIDLIITGHRHSQFVRKPGDKSTLIWPDWGANAWSAGFTDFLDPVSWVVSGGGGGVTSEHAPDYGGNDDQYGFMDLTLSKEILKVEAISHTGITRHTIEIGHVWNNSATTSTATPSTANCSNASTNPDATETETETESTTPIAITNETAATTPIVFTDETADTTLISTETAVTTAIEPSEGRNDIIRWLKASMPWR